jgi:predicted ATP-grasp superfamily ATP-dependent carboligase
MSDYTVLAIARLRKEVAPRVHMALMGVNDILRAHEKTKTLELARELGIRAPVTYAPQDSEELASVGGKVSYPCILKPRCGTGARATYLVHTEEELRQRYAALPAENDLVYDYRPLIQEYVPGSVHDVGALFCRGEPRVLFSQQRLRMRPAIGGPGVDNVTTDEPDLRESAAALLAALQWHGPAQVEFKRDARDGLPTLLEINPRFWGTIELAVRAGLDFPWLTARLAREGDVESVTGYRIGLRCRWVRADDAGWLPGVFRFGSQNVTDFQWTDPMPHLGMLGHWLWPRRLNILRPRKAS